MQSKTNKQTERRKERQRAMDAVEGRALRGL